MPNIYSNNASKVRASANATNVNGTNGSNSVYGNGRDNNVYGKNGNDKLYGAGGNDSLDGGKGNDKIHGQSGSDIMEGGKGKDTLLGGQGNDLYIMDRNDYDIIDDAGGNDEMDIDIYRDDWLDFDAQDLFDKHGNRNPDGKMDTLLVTIGHDFDQNLGFKILHYFDNTERDATLSRSGPGEGCIELLSFDGANLYFTDIRNLAD